MQHSELLVSLLETAEKTRKEYGLKHISAILLVAVCSEFCYSPYTGPGETRAPECYEEERLRYAYKKMYRFGGNMRSPYVNKARQRPDELDIPFDFSQSEVIAQNCQKTVLSADVVFLSALAMIPPQDRFCRYEYRGDYDIPEIVADVDANIYDYVIEISEEVRARFQKRIEQAAASRDWRPADKFAEPKELTDRFFGAIRTDRCSNILNITIPCFFGEGEVTLSIYRVDGIYRLHDNGGTIHHLKQRIPDEHKRERILQKTCHKQWITDGRITGCFSDARGFLYYLQRLIFIAHADLFYTRLARLVYSKDDRFGYADETCAEQWDPGSLLEDLKRCLSFDYDKNMGLYLNVATTYSLYSTRISFLIETLNGTSVRISDRHKGKVEGEIWEAFYWLHEDISPYISFIEKFTKRFGAVLEQNNVYLTDTCENWLPALFRFMNAAVLLSEIGHDIRLPE